MYKIRLNKKTSKYLPINNFSFTESTKNKYNLRLIISISNKHSTINLNFVRFCKLFMYAQYTT